MKKHTWHCETSGGSVMTTVVILLAVASLSVGSVLWTMNGFIRHTERNHYYERALMLADAGVAAATIELNHSGDGAITPADSKQHFASMGSFENTNWWFATSVTTLTNGAKKVTAQGMYRGVLALVERAVSVQGSGQSINALYALAIYAGNSSGNTNYLLEVGGTGTSADFVNGDVHANADISVTDDAMLRNPEDFTDINADELWDMTEEWLESLATTVYSNALSQAEFDAIVASLDMSQVYGNGQYNFGEPFVDNEGNGVFDAGEDFEDLNGDGQYGFGEPFSDADGNGVYDPGEDFTDLGNGAYDVGEEYEDANANGQWDPEIPGHYEGGGWGQVWVDTVPAEPFEDLGNGGWDVGEAYMDLDGVYTENTEDEYLDDRNGIYDYGTTATEGISGMHAPGPGQTLADGGDPQLDPPELPKMYYQLDKTGTKPGDAYDNWGHDIAVADAPFDGNGQVVNATNPAHIFVKNPSWDYVADGGVAHAGGRDDYFITDPTDPTFEGPYQLLSVASNGNDKVYYVDGNLFVHDEYAYDFMFRTPGTRITIVAEGNITISDEIRYNGGRTNPVDGLCLIAMKDMGNTNDIGGNVFFGDTVYGTGGDVHSMMYAENDFLASTLDTSGQPYLSVFGNMSAGNHVQIDRSGSERTRLDVSLDERIRDGVDIPPGLPPAISGQRSVYTETGWEPDTGTWSSYSRLQ